MTSEFVGGGWLPLRLGQRRGAQAADVDSADAPVALAGPARIGVVRFPADVDGAGGFGHVYLLFSLDCRSMDGSFSRCVVRQIGDELAYLPWGRVWSQGVFVLWQFGQRAQ